MTFEEVLNQALALLQRQGRVSYRALKRQFSLDDAYLEDLKLEIIEVHQVAVDQDGTIHHPSRGVTDQDHSRFGALLQARRQVGSIADGGVVHAEIVTNAADHDEPGVQTHAEHTGHAVRFPKLRVVVVQSALQRQRG